MDYEVIGMSDHEVARLMAEIGCADRMERVKRLMWSAQQALKAAGADTCNDVLKSAGSVSHGRE